MMQHQVNVSARFNPETLERVLRVVRHRGFHVCSMNMAAASDAQNINIELTVASQSTDRGLATVSYTHLTLPTN